jgi:hypothetical protein
VDYPTTKTRSLNIAFVLDEPSLRSLAAVLGEPQRALEYTVRWADGTSVRYVTVDEVIRQQNAKENPMVSLIVGTSKADPQPAFIVLRKNPEPTVEYTIDGPQWHVVYLASKLDSWVSAIRQWYSIFSLSGYALLVILTVLFAPFYLWVHVVSHFFPDVPKHATPQPLAENVWFAAIWGGALFALKVFPKGTFAVGLGGAGRYKTIKNIRGTLLYAIPSTVILSLISSWIYDHYR